MRGVWHRTATIPELPTDDLNHVNCLTFSEPVSWFKTSIISYATRRISQRASFQTLSNVLATARFNQQTQNWYISVGAISTLERFR